MHEGGNMSQELLQLMSFGISALMAIIALITLYKSQQKQNDDENTKSVSMELSINYMQKSIDEVSCKQDKLIDASNRSDRRISVIETTLKDVVDRVNQLEGRHE
jgi:septal ring factor EnvC (AmiA/AmiB activator)